MQSKISFCLNMSIVLSYGESVKYMCDGTNLKKVVTEQSQRCQDLDKSIKGLTEQKKEKVRIKVSNN